MKVLITIALVNMISTLALAKNNELYRCSAPDIKIDIELSYDDNGSSEMKSIIFNDVATNGFVYNSKETDNGTPSRIAFMARHQNVGTLISIEADNYFEELSVGQKTKARIHSHTLQIGECAKVK